MCDEAEAMAVGRWPSFLHIRCLILVLAFGALALKCLNSFAEEPQQTTGATELSFYANAHPYLEEPLKRLTKHIPELRRVRPPLNAEEMLPIILEHTGMRVGSLFENIVDLTAHEEIGQQVFTPEGRILGAQKAQYNYLILVNHQESPPRYEEYRTDMEGKPSDQVGVEQGYATTTGFALKCIYFLSGMQADSTFRYLGDEMIGDRDAYVLAFAQKPAQATYWGTVTGEWGTVRILDQGIAWIDKRTFQILRIRTDLLSAHEEIGLERQTTEVTFGQVQIADVEKPLWLPQKASVSAEFQGHAFRNEHSYRDYERFRVSIKMGTPKTYLSCSSRPRE